MQCAVVEAFVEKRGYKRNVETRHTCRDPRRDRVRSVYATIRDHVDVCVTLSAPGAAPKGLDWTGDPLFTVPTSLVGMPTVTLPVLQDENMPLGLQVIGHTNRDADLFANAGGILELF